MWRDATFTMAAKYHDQMQFLNQFLNCERPRISTVVDDEVDNENIRDADIEKIDEV